MARLRLGGHTVIGIDPSSKKIAVVIADKDGFRAIEQQLPVKESDKYTAYNSHMALTFCTWLFDTVLDPESTHVYLEAPVLAGRGKANPQAMLPQAFVSGVIQATAMDAGFVGVTMVAPGSWKKVVVGNGSATKPQVGRNLRRRRPDLWRICYQSGDLKDAGSICLYGCHHLGHGSELDGPRKVQRR